MGPSVNFSFCLAIHQELGGPSFFLRSGSLCHFQLHPVGDKEEGKVPGLAPSKLCGGPLSSGEVTANGGLLCHTQAMGPRLGSWPQAEEGRGDLIPVFAKALCSLGMVGGQSVGDGHTSGAGQLDSSSWVGHPP